MERKRNITLNLILVKVKAVLSTLIVILFFVVAFSGIGLYFAPSGRIARDTGWTFLGLSKTTLENLHSLPSIIWTILLFVHFLLNFRIYKNEIICLIKTK